MYLTSESNCERETDGVVRKLPGEIGPMRRGVRVRNLRESCVKMSLRQWRELADKGERVFAWKRDVSERTVCFVGNVSRFISSAY